MTDPDRFLDRPPSQLAALLLRAGSEEGPSRQSLQRTLSAVGVGAAALGAAGSASALGAASGSSAVAASAGSALSAVSGAKSATLLGALVLAKWAGVGVVSGIAVAVAVHRASPSAHEVQPSPVSTVEVRPVATGGATSAPRATSSPLAELPSASDPLPVDRVDARRLHVEADVSAPLAAEVAFVDRGRSAYQQGDLAGAERALSTYEREFADPRLMPEVLYLRMESALGRGDREPAVRIAERILRFHSRSPHGARARAVLRGE